MGYNLNHNETIESGVKRVLREELADAVAELNRPETERVEAVHECRKHLKKARSLARMVVRDAKDNDVARGVEALRDAARLLAPLREQDAHLECLERLAGSEEVDSACREALAEFRACFVARLTAEQGAVKPASDIFLEAQQMIANASVVLQEEWGNDCGLAELLDGLKRGYVRGRRALRRAARNASPEAIHLLRKRAKDLRYQTTLLMNAWPALLGAFEAELHVFTDHLGAAHDLALLDAALREHAKPRLDDDWCAQVCALIQRRYNAHTQCALNLGRRLYAEKPAPFIRRIGAYCRAWAREGPAPPEA